MPQSDCREIVAAVFATFPADRELSFADLFTARWMSDDCIRVVIHSRRYVTESWLGAHVEARKICRHRNWKYACDDCKLHTENTPENYLQPTPRKDVSKV